MGLVTVIRSPQFVGVAHFINTSASPSSWEVKNSTDFRNIVDNTFLKAGIRLTRIVVTNLGSSATLFTHGATNILVSARLPQDAYVVMPGQTLDLDVYSSTAIQAPVAPSLVGEPIGSLVMGYRPTTSPMVDATGTGVGAGINRIDLQIEASFLDEG